MVLHQQSRYWAGIGGVLAVQGCDLFFQSQQRHSDTDTQEIHSRLGSASLAEFATESVPAGVSCVKSRRHGIRQDKVRPAKLSVRDDRVSSPVLSSQQQRKGTTRPEHSDGWNNGNEDPGRQSDEL